MHIHFWGVRGSLPTPLSPMQLRNRITAVVERITAQDLVSEDARENFVQNLPVWLNGTIGGNTACIELNSDDNQVFILDGGSGLSEMARRPFEENETTFHMFFSHFHWDHIQGIPFFGPIYDKRNTIHIYSPWPATMDILSKQMSYPYFPVKLDACTPNIHFHLLKPLEPIQIGNVRVMCKKMAHPGSSYAYSFIENGKKFIYATDVELTASDWSEHERNKSFFSNADMLVLDAQYTIEELLAKQNWGHSSCCYGVDLALEWGVKGLYLFHHEPNYTDKKLYSILDTARWYADSIKKNKVLHIELATEATDVIL